MRHEQEYQIKRIMKLKVTIIEPVASGNSRSLKLNFKCLQKQENTLIKILKWSKIVNDVCKYSDNI